MSTSRDEPRASKKYPMGKEITRTKTPHTIQTSTGTAGSKE
jgi:hypothetical protein